MSELATQAYTLHDIVQNNAFAVLAIFFVSLIANIIQIFSFLRDRGEISRQGEQISILTDRIRSYEYLFQLAEKNITSDEDLKEVEEDIKNKKEYAKSLDRRMHNLEATMDQRVTEIRLQDTVDQIRNLSEDYDRITEKMESMEYDQALTEKEKVQISERISTIIGENKIITRETLSSAILYLSAYLLIPFGFFYLILLFTFKKFFIFISDIINSLEANDILSSLISMQSLVIFLLLFWIWNGVIGIVPRILPLNIGYFLREIDFLIAIPLALVSTYRVSANIKEELARRYQ